MLVQRNDLALTQEICSSLDDDDGDNGGSESHVGKANGFDSFGYFQTNAALRFVRISQENHMIFAISYI